MGGDLVTFWLMWGVPTQHYCNEKPWGTNGQSDCLILLQKISPERLILQRLFNKDLRGQQICGEANCFCLYLLASYLVFAHSFTKIWKLFNVIKLSTDSPCNWKWSLKSVMITFSRPIPKFRWHHVNWFNVLSTSFFMRTH